MRTEVDNYDHDGTLQLNSTIDADFQYDAIGRLVEQRIEVDSGAGQWITERFTHDALGNVVLHKSGESTSGAQPGNATAYEFDERNLPFRTRYGSGSAAQTTRQKDYDGNGNVRAIRIGIEGIPTTRTLVHDGLDRLVEEVQRDGTRYAVEFDENMNVIRKSFWGLGQGAAAGSPPVLLSMTKFGYDALDRRTSSDHAWLGANGVPVEDGWMSRSTTWTDLSNVQTTTDDRGAVLTYSYDTAGRLVTSVDAAGNSKSYEYDSNNNLVKLTGKDWSALRGVHDSFVSSAEYDALDRVTRIVDPLQQEELFGHDSRGNRTLYVSRRGSTTRQQWDDAGRLIAIVRELTDSGDGSGSIVGQAITSLAWDDSHRLVLATDANGHETQYAYDEVGRRIVVREPDGTITQIGRGGLWPAGASHPDLSSFVAGYDAQGNPEVFVDGNGTVFTSTFNGEGRRTTTLIKPGAGVGKQTTFEVFEYDGLGRTTKARDNDATAIIRYDSASNVTLDQVNGIAVSAVYDGAGRVRSLTYPGGRQIDYTRDQGGNPIRIKEGAATLYAALPLGVGRTEKEFFGNGTSSIRGYGAARQILSLEYFAPGGVSLTSSIGFAWDGEDNKITRNDVLGHARSMELTYDSLNQLSVARNVGANSDAAYQLDSLGNRQLVTNELGAGLYTMSAALPSPGDAQQNQYTTTPMGIEIHNDGGSNVLTRTLGGYWRLERDAMGRLVSARSTGTSHTESYRYDALGRRIEVKSVVSGLATKRVLHYYGSMLLEERDLSGATIATYVHGRYTDQIVSMSRGGVNYTMHSDDLLSTIAVSDASGNVVERYQYTDYGFPVITDASGNVHTESTIGNRFMFTGREYDSATGLYYHRARHMNPITGRFIDRDPQGKWGDPLSRGNALAYVSSNPYSYVDPFGTTTMGVTDGFAWIVSSALNAAIGAVTGSVPPGPKGGAPSGASPKVEFTESQLRSLEMAQRMADAVAKATTALVNIGIGGIPGFIGSVFGAFSRVAGMMAWFENSSRQACAYSVGAVSGAGSGMEPGQNVCIPCVGSCSGKPVDLTEVDQGNGGPPSEVTVNLKPRGGAGPCQGDCIGTPIWVYPRPSKGGGEHPSP